MIDADIDVDAWLEAAQMLSNYLVQYDYLAYIWVKPDRCMYVTRVVTIRVRTNVNDASFEELVSNVIYEMGYTLPPSWITLVPDSILSDEEFPTISFDQFMVTVADHNPYEAW